MTAPVSAAILVGPPDPKPKDAAGAAQQFEALLLGQILRSAREESADDDDDNASATMYDVADQQFSQLLAQNGGLGLARMIAGGLTKESK